MDDAVEQGILECPRSLGECGKGVSSGTLEFNRVKPIFIDTQEIPRYFLIVQ